MQLLRHCSVHALGFRGQARGFGGDRCRQWRRFLLEIGGSSAEGASVERRMREDRGAEGAEGGRVWGGGVPLPTGGGVCAPSPENFSIFELKKARFGAFWV